MLYMKGVMKNFSEKIDFNNYYNDKILKRYEVFGDEKILLTFVVRLQNMIVCLFRILFLSDIIFSID